MVVSHHGQPLTVSKQKPVTRTIPSLVSPAPVRQPPGREPLGDPPI
jgi:hypothetical protein